MAARYSIEPMRRDRRQTWVLRAGGAIVLAATFGYLPYRLYRHSGLARTLELSRDLATMQAQNAALEAEIARISRETEALRGDLRALEIAARSELGYVRPGEVIFDLREAP
jgi:cell division protein FtsB